MLVVHDFNTRAAQPGLPGAGHPGDRFEAVVAHAYNILDRLRAIDLHSYEPLTPNAALQLMASGAVYHLLQCLNDAQALLEGIPEVVPGGMRLHRTASSPSEDLRLSTCLAAIASEGESNPRKGPFCDGVEQAILQFHLTGETLGTPQSTTEFVSFVSELLEALAEVHRDLAEQHKAGSKWGVITAGEDVRHRIQIAVRAAVTIAMRLLEPSRSLDPFPEESTEIGRALVARAVLMQFRTQMLDVCRRALAQPDWELTMRLREVRILLVELVGDAAYAMLRAQDRFLFQTLRRRVTEWLDGGDRAPETARNLLADAAGFCEGLASVNRRRALVLHDAGIRERALDSLSALPSMHPEAGRKRFERILEELDGMRWRNTRLDSLIRHERESSKAVDEPLTNRAKRLAQLLGEVQI